MDGLSPLDEALANAQALLDAVEDPRADGTICGVTRHTARFEFICIREPHLNVRHRSRRGQVSDEDQSRSRRGEFTQGERHHFVNRWPNRPVPALAP